MTRGRRTRLVAGLGAGVLALFVALGLILTSPSGTSRGTTSPVQPSSSPTLVTPVPTTAPVAAPVTTTTLPSSGAVVSAPPSHIRILPMIGSAAPPSDQGSPSPPATTAATPSPPTSGPASAASATVKPALTQCLSTNDCTYANARLTYGGGPVLANPKVYLVQIANGSTSATCTSSYNSAQGTFAASEPNTAGAITTMFTSPYSQWWNEYVPTSPYGRGSYAGCLVINSAALMASTVDDTTIDATLATLQNDPTKGFPAYDPNNIYVLYFQPNQLITADRQNSQNDFCAYHGNSYNYGIRDLNYVVMPYETQAGCMFTSSSTSMFVNMTPILSHEIGETVTDPVPSSPYGWIDNVHGGDEIGDLCEVANSNATMAIQSTAGGATSYNFQYLYSNQAAGCIGVPLTPTAPTSAAASVTSSSSVTISWKAPVSNGGAPVSSYTVSSPTAPTPLSCVQTTALSCTYSGLNTGATYAFSVIATNAVGPSVAATVRTTLGVLPSAPQSVTATSFGNGQSLISWKAPLQSGSTAVSSYTVSSVPAVAAPASCVRTTALSCTFSGLTNGVNYTFSVVAANTIGQGAPAKATATPATTASAPTLLSAVSGQNLQTTLSWRAPSSNGGAAVTSYTVSSTPSVTTPASCVRTTALSCTYSGLTNGVTYTFSVLAANANGQGPPAQATATPATTSSAPTLLSAVSGQNLQTTLSWKAPSSNGGAAVTSYTVSSTPSVTTPASCVRTTALSCTFSGLTNGVSYTFFVVATNAAGNSLAASTTATPKALTPAAPVVSSSLSPGGRLLPGQSLVSPSGFYRAVFQTDGNFVIYNAWNYVIWNSGSQNRGGSVLYFQGDGNVVIYRSDGRAVWASGVQNSIPGVLALQNSGVLQAINKYGYLYWQS
jgi:Fibronectin type III domain